MSEPRFVFQTSESTEKIDVALAKVQAEILPAAKDKVNPHYKSRYADLSAIWDACRSALVKHGIAVSQWPVHSTDDNRAHLVTRLSCSGGWIQAESSIPVQKQDPQGFGAAITYLRRFALASALGIVAEEDDDGNYASGKTSHPESRPPQAATRPNQLASVQEFSEKSGGYTIPFGKFKGKALEDVPKEQLASYSNYLRAKAHEDNKPLSGSAKEFVDRVHTLFEVDSRPTEFVHTDEVPF